MLFVAVFKRFAQLLYKKILQCLQPWTKSSHSDVEKQSAVVNTIDLCPEDDMPLNKRRLCRNALISWVTLWFILLVCTTSGTETVHFMSATISRLSNINTHF